MVRFYQLGVGARFEFRGRQYEKTAMSMAVDLPPEGKRWGNIFMGMTEVSTVGRVILLEAEVAERWKGDWEGWEKRLAKAPGAGFGL